MSNHNSAVKILEAMIFVLPDFTTWTGQAKLRTKDIKLGDGGELPPADLASLGSKVICPPEKLRPFKTLKQQNRRALLDHGLKLLGGYAIPITKIDTIKERLAQDKLDFDCIKSDFLAEYDNTIIEFIQDNILYEDLIRDALLTRDEVEKRFDFQPRFFEVHLPTDSDGAVTLSDHVAELGDNLMSDVIRRANECLSAFLGKKQVDKKTKSSLVKTRSKVDGLSFLDGNLVKIVDLIDQALTHFEAESGRYLKGTPLLQVMSCLLIMSERKHINSFLEGDLTVDDMDDFMPAANSIPELEVKARVEVKVAKPEPEPSLDDFDIFLASKAESAPEPLGDEEENSAYF